MTSTNLDQIIRKHALKNAHDFGKASAGSVVGKVIGEVPDCKTDMKGTMQKINAIVSEINKLSKEAVEEELKNYHFEEKKKEEKKELEVEGAEIGKVVTRFAPEPSGYSHIGHAKALCLVNEITRNYQGKLVLRFDDTNPEKESQEYVEGIKEGITWLGIKWDEENYTSDHIQEIYEYAEKLISKEKAYVCTCKQETISKLREEMKPCACHGLKPKDNLLRWKDMLNGKYNEGDAILRFRGNLSALNTVMRDPMLARIIIAKHYRQAEKYRVWPGYDLAVCIMDLIEGTTHPMRSKEYELRDELYQAIFTALDLIAPKMIGFSRLAIKGAPISKRLLVPLVKEGKVLGWDDPRLPTLVALRRRGIIPQAIKNFVLSFGLSKVESEPTWERLLVENKKLIEPTSKHYFFVSNPVKMKIKNAKETDVKIKLHPSADYGFREIKVNDTLYISSSDAESLKKNEIFRLKDLSNAKLITSEKELTVEQMPDAMVEKKIQWVSEESKIDCEIMVPKELVDENKNYIPNSLEIVKGYCESDCMNLDIGDMIQFERFGFCRLDKKEKDKLIFIFTC
ncbi:MAG: glutamate--tRNA ligase [Candidatus Micrarchaeota archaeon]|mgnify:CR=1 FL=1